MLTYFTFTTAAVGQYSYYTTLIPGRVLLLLGTIVNRTKYLLVKMVKYVGFYVNHRSY